MNERSHRWFQEAVQAGMDQMVAHYGAEVIDSWENFWKYSITAEILEKMKEFGLRYPAAAKHRWGLQAGPCPWVPQEEEGEMLNKDPRYSPFDGFTPLAVGGGRPAR
jgi:hypothetical protein